MFSQTSLTNRRQFLERSMLGFGSAFLLPSLLTSCTDHINPNPDPGPDPSLLGDGEKFNWNNNFREAVILGIGQIPEAGEILAGITKSLWPEKSDVDPFTQIQAQVKALIDQEIDKDTYNKAREMLGNLKPEPYGLASDINDYTSAINDQQATPQDILYQWDSARKAFNLNMGLFRSPGQEVMLLPLFAQYANMYLPLLRDGIINGKKWDMKDEQYASNKNALGPIINDFVTYVDYWYERGKMTAVEDGLTNASKDLTRSNVEPFATFNKFNRNMTLSVLDYRASWPYYDYDTYPDGKKGPDGKSPIKVTELLSREIYSDPYGSTPAIGSIPWPSPLGGAPKTLPSALQIWSGDRVDAIQVYYPPNSGPAGVTQTTRMGGNGGSLDTVPNQPNSNPITQFRIKTESNQLDKDKNLIAPIISLFQLGDYTNVALKQYGGNDKGNVYFKEWVWSGLEYPGEAISSIYVNGAAPAWSTANCIVVGFKYWESTVSALRAVRYHYVTSPREKTIDELKKVFPNVPIPRDLITAELKAERLAHWTYVRASVKK